MLGSTCQALRDFFKGPSTKYEVLRAENLALRTEYEELIFKHIDLNTKYEDLSTKHSALSTKYKDPSTPISQEPKPMDHYLIIPDDEKLVRLLCPSPTYVWDSSKDHITLTVANANVTFCCLAIRNTLVIRTGNPIPLSETLSRNEISYTVCYSEEETERLLAQFRKLYDELNDLRPKYEARGTHIINLQADHEDALAELKDLRTKYEAQSLHVEELITQNDDAITTIRSLRAQLEALRTENEALLQKLAAPKLHKSIEEAAETAHTRKGSPAEYPPVKCSTDWYLPAKASTDWSRIETRKVRFEAEVKALRTENQALRNTLASTCNANKELANVLILAYT